MDPFSCVIAALRIDQRLKDVEATENDEVTFDIQLSKTDSRGKWFKDGHIIYPSHK